MTKFFFLKSTCKKSLILLVLTILAISVSGKPHLRKTCGRDLVARVDRICQSRGGHLPHTDVKANKGGRRGIVNECCLQICADYDIHPYCLNANDDNDNLSETKSLDDIAVYNEMPENRMPEAQALTRDGQPVIKSIVDETTVAPEEITTETISERKLKSPHFQVGTVPPEYRMSPFVPSHSRLMN